MNCLLSESLQRKTDELNEVLDAKHHLDEIVISKQNVVNFSRFQLENMLSESDRLLEFVNLRRKLSSGDSS